MIVATLAIVAIVLILLFTLRTASADRETGVGSTEGEQAAQSGQARNGSAAGDSPSPGDAGTSTAEFETAGDDQVATLDSPASTDNEIANSSGNVETPVDASLESKVPSTVTAAEAEAAETAIETAPIDPFYARPPPYETSEDDLAGTTGAPGEATGAAGSSESMDAVHAGGPAIFFESEAEGNSVAYVVDASSSMASGIFEEARAELVSSLMKLNRKQKVFIVFFNDTAYPQPFDRLVTSSLKNKKKLKKWVAQAAPRGGTNPVEAAKLALSKNPNAVFILSDGEFYPHAVQEITAANTRSTSIHTIGFHTHAHTLQELAELNGGTYRHVE